MVLMYKLDLNTFLNKNKYTVGVKLVSVLNKNMQLGVNWI